MEKAQTQSKQNSKIQDDEQHKYLGVSICGAFIKLGVSICGAFFNLDRYKLKFCRKTNLN